MLVAVVVGEQAVERRAFTLEVGRPEPSPAGGEGLLVAEERAVTPVAVDVLEVDPSITVEVRGDEVGDDTGHAGGDLGACGVARGVREDVHHAGSVFEREEIGAAVEIVVANTERPVSG